MLRFVLPDPQIDRIDRCRSQVGRFKQDVSVGVKPTDSLVGGVNIRGKLGHRNWYHATIFASLQYKNRSIWGNLTCVRERSLDKFLHFEQIFEGHLLATKWVVEHLLYDIWIV